MTATTIRVQIAQRKDTAANWTSANPILLSGEFGYETDTKKFKIGDGSTSWNSLAYLYDAKIIAGNTEAEVVDTGSDGHFKVTTEGTERLRVGPAGQIGIAGANYGTSGQVLTSGGASGVVTWAAASTGAVVVDGGNFDTGGSAVSTSSTIDGGSFD